MHQQQGALGLGIAHRQGSRHRAGLGSQALGARRKDVIVATKFGNAMGKGLDLEGGASRGYIVRAVEASLKRLQTDVIDLYQLHWPVRGSYHFRQNWGYDPSAQNRADVVAHMLDVLAAMQKAVDAGKIRAFGLSNESAWGTAQWLRLSEDNNWPRVATMQNEYSLLCRMYDTDLAELSVNEDVGLIAFSPLACGLLIKRSGCRPVARRPSPRSRPPSSRVPATWTRCPQRVRPSATASVMSSWSRRC